MFDNLPAGWLSQCRHIRHAAVVSGWVLGGGGGGDPGVADREAWLYTQDRVMTSRKSDPDSGSLRSKGQLALAQNSRAGRIVVIRGQK